ncbi:response regulator [Novosphingobium piscinae]|uniref:Response regulator n=1 Tax=Novosphingobium piscinae TaxID=1507448 RepID=A0A7X1G031_9SPHN|nr:response regulator [Novosphingobium piscinae]MBC2670188.1 response regulator [Novosphingobium piscinae]
MDAPVYEQQFAVTRLMLVEDDGPLRTLITRNLREHGFEIAAVATAAELWLVLEKESFDLIILDIMLPGMNGLDVLRRLRRTLDTPVIFLSARGSEEDRIVGLELGADDFLPKPFNTRELVARIGAVLRRRSGEVLSEPRAAAGDIVFSGWTLARASRELRSPSGMLVDLTTAEFDLLNAFVSYPQRAIGREKLIELSRTRLGDSSDRSVDVLVSRLRRKLAGPDGSAPIKTVRGVGYMFTVPVTRQ